MQIPQRLSLAPKYYLSASLFGLLALLYLPLLIYWIDGWLYKSISINHEYFSHALIGMPLGAYITWTKRHQWQQLPDIFHPLGGFLVGLGAVGYLSGLPDLVSLSFPALLAGICLWLKGMSGLRLLAFPLLLVLLATPNSIPYLLTPYTLPLQQFIAGVAGFILIQFMDSVSVQDVYLYVNDKIVEVAPYCAGLKMLFTTLYVSLILLYWTQMYKFRGKTIGVFLGAVLISVCGNIVRNTLLTFFFGTGRLEAFAWLHEGWGGDLYSAFTLGLLVMLVKQFDNYFPLDEPERFN